MGFIEGTRVKVIRNAPLMDPIDIEIRGYQIALRRHEARGVEVQMT
jgi:Fe2+ transport system protein FeoA